MIGKSRLCYLAGVIAWLGAGPAQGVVTTYCCDAAAETDFLADLAALGGTLSTPHEGFDASPWGEDTYLPGGGSPAPSVTNLGITWSPRVAGGYLATSTAAGNVHDGSYLMYAVDSGGVNHPFPDGFRLDAEGPVLHGVGGWFRASGTAAKLAFIVDGDPAWVDFTGEQATVSAWKFLGFIDDTGAFTGVEVRTADEAGNEARTFFSDAFTFGTTAAPPNSAPVATADSYGVDEGGALSPAAPGVLGNDTDADNLPPANAWDGLSAALVAASGPSHATAFTLSGDGSFVYTHDGSETVSDGFSYRAFDGTNYSDPVAVTIDAAPVNDAPVGAADSYSLLQGGIFDVAAPGVLGNDSDPDNLLPAEAWQGLTASLVPGKGPLHAFDFLLNGDGSFIYIHDGGVSTADSFVYRASDGAADSAEVMVSLAITPTSCSGEGEVAITERAFTSGTTTCESGTSIIVGPTVWVALPAQLILRAPIIRFQSGVSVELGSTLTAGPPP